MNDKTYEILQYPTLRLKSRSVTKDDAAALETNGFSVMNATDNAPAILNDDASCEPISMDCSVAQLLRTLKAQGFGKTHQSRGFRQPFIDNPYLEQATPRQLLSSPLAMGDFLQRCRALPNCGEAQMSLLLAAIELVATPNVDEDAGLR